MYNDLIRIKQLDKLIDYIREEFGNDPLAQKEIDLLNLQREFLTGDQPWEIFRAAHPEVVYFEK
jgi:hypothetical protein